MTTTTRRWRPSSIAFIVLAWAILQLGGLFTPGLLDDVDSIYIQIAREMLQRHDFVTPTIDGIRFFDKPPLMYWMAAGSMHLFGQHDWAARLPLALGVLALLFAVYALGNRLYAATSPSLRPDRAGLYAALAMATALGPYLYTRFYIPDILLALWMTLAVHLFLIALDRVENHPNAVILSEGTRGSMRVPQSKDLQDHPPAPASQTLSTSTAPGPLLPSLLIATDRVESDPNSVILSEGTRGFMRVPQSKDLQHRSPAPASQTLSTSTAASPLLPSLSFALDRVETDPNSVILSEGTRGSMRVPSKDLQHHAPAPASQTLSTSTAPSPLLPSLGFATVIALDVLTKGLIGIVFPLGFVLLYLAFTGRLKALLKLHIPAATALFFAIAAPWHILAALRNPAIAMPAGFGLPARAGWAWFYLYNEHVARFLGKRIPHDYGQVPVPLFWLLLLLWLLPWVAWLPSAILDAVRELRGRSANLRFDFDADFSPDSLLHPNRRREAALALLLWPALILGFFTLSSRQEYYHLPALPALALLVGGLLAAADAQRPARLLLVDARKQALRGALFFLVPLGVLLFVVCGYFALTAPHPRPGVTLTDLLNSNPENYNLSLGHLYDLTGQAMGFFRGPLWTVALGMLTLGPIAYLVRRRGRTYAANLLVAAAMTAVLLGAHEGLVRFYPILGSKDLALQIEAVRQPTDLVLIDGELTAGSTLLFYTATPAPNTLLVNGHINGPWFGSFWPDAPHIFATDADLHHLWAGPQRAFLLTYHPADRAADLAPYGPVHALATSGGKTVLTNR